MSAEPERRVPWGLMDILGVVGLTVLGWAIVIVLGAVFAPAPWRDLHSTSVLLGLTAILYVVLYVAIVLVVVRRVGWQAIGYRFPGWEALLGVIAFLPIWFGLEAAIGAAATIWLNHGKPIPSNTTELFGTGGPASLGISGIVLVFVVAAVIAPIVEETFFRGLLYQWLRGHLGIVLSALISALIFGAAHGLPLLLPVLITLGCILAAIFQRTRSLYASMLLHAANNAAAIAIVLVAPR